VFTIKGRFSVNRDRARDYKKDFLHRLSASGVRDERFIEQFLERHDVVRDLKSAYTEGSASYESALDDWITSAVSDYELLWLERPASVQGEGVQGVKVKPKKRRRTHRPKAVAGPWERQEALAQYVTRVASDDEKILNFRKNVLSGRTLSEEEALNFLSSPLAAAKSRAVFKMLRVDVLDTLLDTKYRVEEAQDDRGPYRKVVRGRRRSHTLRPLGAVATKLMFPGDVVRSDDLRGLRLQGGRAVIFPHPREEDRFVVAKTGSIIGDVASVAEDSLKGYPISSEMGVWFILTGEFVPEDPVRIRYTTTLLPELSRTTITLEMEVWLPPEEVTEQYRHAQHEILGKTPRSLKRDTLTVFEFVNQNKEMSWRKLFEVWNEVHPRSKHFKDRSHLYTTYTRAVENIAGIKSTKTK
jgi:hypothetical protein